MADPTPASGHPDESLLAAYIGPKWERVYKDVFRKIAANGGRFTFSINLAAAVCPVWFAYRRLYREFAAFFAVFALFVLVEELAAPDPFFAGRIGYGVVATFLVYALAYPLIAIVALICVPWQIGELVQRLVGRSALDDHLAALGVCAALTLLTSAQGVFANWLLYRRAVAHVTGLGMTPAEAAAPEAPRARPAVNRWVAWATPLAAVGLLFYSCQQMGRSEGEAPYRAALKSDLRNLVTAEESYYADSVAYTRSLSAMQFTPSEGVTIRFLEVQPEAWSAVATHPRFRQPCAIFVGHVPPPVAGAVEGEPTCGELRR